MKLAISNIAWDPKQRIEIYQLLKKEKFKGIEIAPMLFLFDEKNFLKPNKKNYKKKIFELKKFNLKIISMQSLLYNSENCDLFKGERNRKNFIARMTKIINLAGILKIPNLVFGSPKNRVIPQNMDYMSAEKVAVKVFRKLGKIAKKNNTYISIESNPKVYGTNFLNNIYQTYNFVKKVNSKNIRIILDTGELVINKELKDLKKILEKIKKFINHVHISQPFLKPINNEYLLKNIFKELKKLKYAGWISIEMKKPDFNNYKKILNSIKKVKKFSI